MDATIVVLIDYEDNTFKLFGEYNRTIAFDNAFLLPVFLEGREVLYITNASVVEGEDVLELANQIVQSMDFECEPKYLHAKVEGYTRVSDVRLSFAGPKDAKPMDKLGYDVFQKSKQLADLLRAEKVEIITETQAKALKKMAPGQRVKDKALDEILLKKSVAETLEEDSMWQDMDEVSGDEEVLTENEQMVARGLGKREG